MAGFKETFFSPENREVTMKLLRYSLMMFLFPISVFYFFFDVVFSRDPAMLGWSGIAAVVAANCVIAAYVFMAFTEEDENPRQKPEHRTR